MHPTLLLKEKGDLDGMTLIPDIGNPVFLHGSCYWAAFATGYDPINALQVEVGQRTNKGLER